MEDIRVMQRVQVVKAASPEQQQLLNKIGQVTMIIDGNLAMLVFDDGSDALVNVSQLKRVGG